ncbi:MAG: QueT transporter family protein [bacterium]|nr:QueT transporter family protein [candidate division KSB1 bacterium]MDH7558961.1 QueT transporter family protein [bacterium]
MTSKQIATAGIIGALYAALTVVLSPISYGPLQVRVAEALTVLPFVTPWAIPGLYFGCMVANVFGGLGPVDIFGGSFISLVAACLTYLLRCTGKAWLAPLPPILCNAFGVSLYLHRIAGMPYWLTVLYIAAGEAIACCALGYPLLVLLQKRSQPTRGGTC